MSQDNTAIIFIHGATGSHSTWNFQKEGLSEEFRVISIDLPGHLDSNCPESTNMEMYVKFLQSKIEELNLEKIILTGHSMGGAVVLSYYFHHPEKVFGLILIGTGARLRVLPIILELTKTNFPEYVRTVKSTAFHKNTIINKPDLIKEVENNMARIPPHIAHCDYNICNQFDVMYKLGEIEVPTLIICGDNDKLTPIKYSEYMKKHIRNSELFIIEEAGHMVMLEQANAVNNIISEFIRKIL